jgi:CubicO group peptidase (beta-lactamase class C family)
MKKLIFFVALLLFSLNSCYVAKAIKHRKYKLKDLNHFEYVSFAAKSKPFEFAKGAIMLNDKQELDSMFLGSNTYSFMVIRNDSIIYSFQNLGIKDSSMLPSFSVAKSFVSTLIQIAHQEGKIKDLQEPITNYIPELLNQDTRFQNITIQHVLDMRSGIKSNENYANPFSDVLKLGFGKNVKKKMLRTKIESAPGKRFEYKSANTQLLAMILEKAVGEKIYDYFYKKLYTPLGMKYSGTWMIDDKKNKDAKAFCCMNLAIEDYAKFGKMYLNKGNFNGQQILDSNLIIKNLNTDTFSKYAGYKNQWWANSVTTYYKDSSEMNRAIIHNNWKVKYILLPNKNHPQWGVSYYDDNYEAVGILNQYITILPSKNTLILHFGNEQLPHKPLKRGVYFKVRELFF